MAPVVQAIRSRLGTAGFEVPRAYVVVAGHWADASASDEVADQWRRLPVESSRRGTPPGRAAGHPPDAHHGRFVPIAPASEQRRARSMAALGVLTNGVLANSPATGRSEEADPGHDGVGGEEAVGQQPPEVEIVENLLRWNAVLTAEAGSPLPSDARSVALLWSLRHRVVRDCVLMMCAWGFDAGVIALHEATEPEGCTIGAPAVYDTFLGVGARSPAPGALRTAIDLLRHLVSCAPESMSPPALTMLAWLEWARGRGLVADAYLEACRGAEPGYQLARLLQVMIQHGFVPEWVGADSAPTLSPPR